MVPSDRALATSYRLSIVTTNHVSICSGLAAISNGVSSYNWPYPGNGERDKAKVTINQSLIGSGIRRFR